MQSNGCWDTAQGSWHFPAVLAARSLCTASSPKGAVVVALVRAKKGSCRRATPVLGLPVRRCRRLGANWWRSIEINLLCRILKGACFLRPAFCVNEGLHETLFIGSITCAGPFAALVQEAQIHPARENVRISLFSGQKDESRCVPRSGLSGFR